MSATRTCPSHPKFHSSRVLVGWNITKSFLFGSCLHSKSTGAEWICISFRTCYRCLGFGVWVWEALGSWWCLVPLWIDHNKSSCKVRFTKVNISIISDIFRRKIHLFQWILLFLHWGRSFPQQEYWIRLFISFNQCMEAGTSPSYQGLYDTLHRPLRSGIQD